MVLRGSILAGILLVATMASADVAEDILGEWTQIDPVELPGMYPIFTFEADGTYQVEIITSGGTRVPVEEGTYEVSETELVFRSAGEESRLEIIIGEGSLILYDPEEEQVLVFEKGVITPEPLGTASISGTIN